ncbi:MAG: alpha/beta hydrolase [Bacteroidales bacterium]|nr:alpha/beta hydrolase [Bacteroidales bacterium]
MRKAILAIFLIALTSTCQGRPIKIVSGDLYKVTTAADSGYVRFHKAGLFTWEGTFYADKGKLYAQKQILTIRKSRQGYYQKETGQKLFLKEIVPYSDPIFIERPKTCEYRDSVYAVKVKKDVVYARAVGYWADFPDSDEPFMSTYLSKITDKRKKEIPLTMDVYMPKDKGVASRPLLVLIHGGGFYNGNKTNAGYKEWGEYFASLGYTVASVNYRLGFHANKASIERSAYRALQDVNAAIRFIVKNYKDYGVDPQRVFVAGTSAGAITALNVAYMRDENVPSSAKGEGPIDGVSPHTKADFSIRGVGSMWGAVNDLEILKNANIPIISFHSTGDPVVPYGTDHPFQDVFANELITPLMHGDGEIVPYAKNLGIKAVLHTYDLPGIHSINIGEDFKINKESYVIQYALRDFFADVMLPHPVRFRILADSQIIRIEGTDVAESTWKVSGGVVQATGTANAKILLFPDVPEHSVTVSGRYTNGLTFYEELPL